MIPGFFIRLLTDLYLAAKVTEDTRSCFTLVYDLIAYRFITRLHIKQPNTLRTIRMRGNCVLKYRLNSGDVYSLKEVWLYEVYRLPYQLGNGCLIDLGANIGMASVWLAKHYGIQKIVAVEPVPKNVALATINLSINRLEFTVVECAASSIDGVCNFTDAESSNTGRISSMGRAISVQSMNTILGKVSDREIELVKIDIEGAEESVLSTNLEWLSRIRALAVEFHSKSVRANTIAILNNRGFRHQQLIKGKVFAIDFFMRDTQLRDPVL